MAKHTALLAFLAVALLIANTYAYRATVKDSQEERRYGYERCQQQGGRQQTQSCERYLMQQSRDVIEMRGIDVDQNRGDIMDECCRQLRMVDEECRCQQLKELVDEQQQRQMPRRQEEQMLEKARMLPSMCGMRPKRCDF